MRIINEKRVIGILVVLVIFVYAILISNAGSTFRQRNIPLSLELQKYAFELCKKENVSYEIFLALMWKESRFKINAISRNGLDKGLCQIRESVHRKTLNKLKINNIMDAKQNIRFSIYLLSNYVKKYKNESYHIILMCYNLGEGGAKSMWKKRVWSTRYTWDIINYSKKLY